MTGIEALKNSCNFTSSTQFMKFSCLALADLTIQQLLKYFPNIFSFNRFPKKLIQTYSVFPQQVVK